MMVGLSVSAEMPDTLTIDTLSAEKQIGIIRRTVREFDRLDDEYIEPQHYEFTVMGQVTRTYESFIIGSNGQRITLAPDGLTKIGPYFGWRWFFLGYTFDIKNIGFSQNGLRKEFDLSIYSSQVGVDLFYRRTGNDYKIRDVRLGYRFDSSLFEGMPFDGVNVGITGASAYYIFNHGRFSYPAAFSQSTCQKISCGSWMAGVGFTKNTLSMDYDKLESTLRSRIDRSQELKLDSGMMFSDIKYSDYMISGGYAYNWVFAKNWLFCASGQLALCYKSSYGKIAGEKKGFSFDKVNLDGIGRFGLVYNNTRWYAGCSAILRTNHYHTAQFTANNIFGSFNAYIGYNFMLKKKYRKT
ncbi:MAG: DUF4421 domain-containing protein [Prevotella sp.]|nr:DUF4421 domain-containing protein [Prevotella sp.]